MHPSGNNFSELENWLSTSTSLLNEGQDSDGRDATATGDNGDAWIYELHDRAHHGTFLTTPDTVNNPVPVLVQVLQEQPATVAVEEAVPTNLTLDVDLRNHPCRIGSAFQHSLTHGSGATTWGHVLAETSHLVYQHVRSQSMGTTVPDKVFKHVREIVMIRLARSSFRPEAVRIIVGVNEFDEEEEGIVSSWGSPIFCQLFRLHLNEVARTAREGNCEKAKYFVCEASDHSGILRSDLTDDAKNDVLSQMTFSAEYGCKLLHRSTKDGKLEWFANHDFAHVIRKSLYDVRVTCPGWCGALEEMKLPDTGDATTCQLTEASVYTVAIQIAWLVHVARYYLESKLDIATTFRPSKRRLGNPWIDWTETLNGYVVTDAKIITQFITGLLAPNAGQDMKVAFHKLQMYTDFIARPSDIPHRGSLGSFFYADPLPLLIDDQSLLNTELVVV